MPVRSGVLYPAFEGRGTGLPPESGGTPRRAVVPPRRMPT